MVIYVIGRGALFLQLIAGYKLYKCLTMVRESYYTRAVERNITFELLVVIDVDGT